MIAFVHINKTAGTSVKFILRNTFSLHHCDAVTHDPEGAFTADELAFARRLFPGLRSLSGHPLCHPSARLPGPIGYFTFVRDPIERCASQYQQIHRGDLSRRSKYRREKAGYRKPSFEEFIHDPRYRNLQAQRIAGGADFEAAKREIADHYFFVGLTERFHESIHVLRRLSPHPIDVRYRRLKVAPDNTLKRRLLGDPTTRRLLVEANEVDQELYDYVRAVLYPDQLKRARIDSASLAARNDEIDFDPLRYRMSRLYNNAVYKQAMKLRRRLGGA